VLALGALITQEVGVSLAQGSAPTSEQAKPAEDETLTLRQRAANYWAARVARDYKAQWELSEPRLKGRITPEEYAAGKGAIQYLGYEVGDAKIEGSFATVQVKVIARISLPRSQAKPVLRTATVPDAWVKVEGVWYRRSDQPREGPGTQSTLQ
jgi:hypothetical protein